MLYDLNVYYGVPNIRKRNLPGNSTAVEHWYKGPADFSSRKSHLTIEILVAQSKGRQQADDFVTFAIIQFTNNPFSHWNPIGISYVLQARLCPDNLKYNF